MSQRRKSKSPLHDQSYRICVKCVMDTTDPDISFDDEGVCSHCHRFEEVIRHGWLTGEDGRLALERKLAHIRREGVGREYDVILGLSGGVDSSYVALKAAEWDLRVLVVHVDAGWNSEIAVSNIEKLLRFGQFDLETLVVNWEEMADLHRAYLKAGIANQDVPQDHIFFASLYHFAMKHGIKCILSGGNIATEAVFPDSWHGSAMDSMNLRAIHKEYGSIPLRQYRTINFLQYYFVYPILRRMRVERPLNYMSYSKNEAIGELMEKVEWRPYERKHGESLFTKVFQNYYLPKVFGYDKRKPHLSSLILSGEITRNDALKELNKPLYDPDELEIDLNYFCKKLEITRKELNGFMASPIRHYDDFQNWTKYYRIMKKTQSFFERRFNRRIRVYS